MDGLLGNIPTEYLPIITIVVALLAFFCLAIPAILGAKIPLVHKRIWCKRFQRWAEVKTIRSKNGKIEIAECDLKTTSCTESCLSETENDES